jgi:hypothetical protein
MAGKKMRLKTVAYRLFDLVHGIDFFEPLACVVGKITRFRVRLFGRDKYGL